MMNAETVELACLYYDGLTLSGLCRCLRISAMTLWRIEQGYYEPQKPYGIKRVSANRRIPTSSFPTICEATRQVRKRRRAVRSG